jgi:hypothetical protein
MGVNNERECWACKGIDEGAAGLFHAGPIFMQMSYFGDKFTYEAAAFEQPRQICYPLEKR